MTQTCKGCDYRVGVGNDSICGYLEITGHLRGGTAEECTHYTPAKTKRKNLSVTIMPAKPEAERQLDDALITAARKRRRA